MRDCRQCGGTGFVILDRDHGSRMMAGAKRVAVSAREQAKALTNLGWLMLPTVIIELFQRERA